MTKVAKDADEGKFSLEKVLRENSSTIKGLSDSEAAKRLTQEGRTRFANRQKSSALLLFLSQFKSPIVLMLIFAAALSGFLGDAIDSLTIVAIVLVASILSFYQEHQAGQAMQELLKLVQTKIHVRRGGKDREIAIDQVVSGDIVLLESGSSVPGDGYVVESNDLMLNESSLTGESMPVEKAATDKAEDRKLFEGTYVISGSGVMLVTKTGADTEFGAVVERLKRDKPEPEFHIGIRRYGYMLMEFTLLLTFSIFAVNIWLHRPFIDSLLFSLALAVGLTPQLLPAIMSVTMTKGARDLAAEKVVVKRLEAIEDFGSMDVLCSDKTGTLTEGKVQLHGTFNKDGESDEEVLRLACLNAKFQTGYTNPIDESLLEQAPKGFSKGIKKIGMLPYDFSRKRVSVLVSDGDKHVTITKGAFESILECCKTARDASGKSKPISDEIKSVRAKYEEFSQQGLRVLGLAVLEGSGTAKEDIEEDALEFVGMVVFEDPLRPDTVEVVASLREKGVQLKVLTGDNRLVAAHLAAAIGLKKKVITGKRLNSISTQRLKKVVNEVDVFAEIDPVQKERLILALKKAGHVVGYIGDGINDSAALHAADVGISVDGAASVAKEAADLVMLERGLAVISRGVEQGRHIFANTLKYVFITTSANFGNMFSMAIGSLFLPFLPLLPKQILLNNFLTDIPAMSISGDSVDKELVQTPRRWDVKALRTFMLVYGFQSSLFDLISFVVFLKILHANPSQFQTAWFVESALSELLILLVIRTKSPFFKSRPGRPLWLAVLIVAIIVLLLPIFSLTGFLGFSMLPISYLGAIGVILAFYVATAELLKRRFLKL